MLIMPKMIPEEMKQRAVRLVLMLWMSIRI
jgi:hypothetical protein